VRAGELEQRLQERSQGAFVGGRQLERAHIAQYRVERPQARFRTEMLAELALYPRHVSHEIPIVVEHAG
jgi:hypothetical protein